MDAHSAEAAPGEDGAGEGATPHLVLDGFSGPLALLLSLAREKQIDLAHLSVADLVDQLAVALQQARTSLGEKGSWVVMACWGSRPRHAESDDKKSECFQHAIGGTHGRKPVSAWGASLRSGRGALAGIRGVRVLYRHHFRTLDTSPLGQRRKSSRDPRQIDPIGANS